MPTNTGAMRYDIILQEKVVTKDDYGSDHITFVDKYSLKAELKYLNGLKGTNAGEIFTSSKIQFNIYYREGILPNMLVIFKGQKYAIESIQETSFRAALTLTCNLIND
jgi:SPP1 family predicted phage head-tail adaptor